MTNIAKLDHRAIISVKGVDWETFLQGLCTLDTHSFKQDPDKLFYGAFLRPQGKIFSDVIFKVQSADCVWLDVAKNVRDELIKTLKMYRLRAKVEIEAVDNAVFVAFDSPLPLGFLCEQRSQIIGSEFGFCYEPCTDTATQSDWVKFRYTHTLSDPGYDFAKDELYAIDANFDLLGAIDFKKGCYVGQELTSRMKRRGTIKNRILAFNFTDQAPERGSELLNADLRAGQVLACHETAGLALMRLDRMDGDIHHGLGDIKLRIDEWIKPHIVITPLS